MSNYKTGRMYGNRDPRPSQAGPFVIGLAIVVIALLSTGLISLGGILALLGLP